MLDADARRRDRRAGRLHARPAPRSRAPRSAAPPGPPRGARARPHARRACRARPATTSPATAPACTSSCASCAPRPAAPSPAASARRAPGPRARAQGARRRPRGRARRAASARTDAAALDRTAPRAGAPPPRPRPHAGATLAAHDPQRTLERGYALLEDPSGEPVTSAGRARARAHPALTIRFRDGDGVQAVTTVARRHVDRQLLDAAGAHHADGRGVGCGGVDGGDDAVRPSGSMISWPTGYGMTTARKLRTTFGQNWPPAPSRITRDADVRRRGGLVDALGRDRVVDVGDGRDARELLDLRRRRGRRGSRSRRSARGGRGRPRPRAARGRPERSSSTPGERMGLHDVHLGVGQPAGLVEDLRRDGELADVVHEQAEAELAHPVLEPVVAAAAAVVDPAVGLQARRAISRPSTVTWTLWRCV